MADAVLLVLEPRMPLQLHSADSGLGPQRTEVVNTAAVQQIFDRVGFK